MADTYALTIRIESYEYSGDIYIVGEGHTTPQEVLQHVAADQIVAIETATSLTQYLLDLLEQGGTVSSDEYDAFDADLECSLYADVYYHRFSFWTGEKQVELGRRPSRQEIDAVSENV
jgi:hypothetical protein